jgi:HlyD family secretion protein
VVYQRDWDGRKRGIGSQISTWENVVATLPNLTEMITKTFVNEIDISKVKVGQTAEIGVDAFPDKKFTGEVIEVANIGEQMRNSSAKVFEVKIEVNEYDSVLRPAMTTKNIIITEVIDSVMFVPLEAVHSVDTITFVYTGNRRQQIIPGRANDNEIIVHAGIETGDKVRLIPPEDPESFRMTVLSKEILDQHKIKLETQKPTETPERKVKDRPSGNDGTQRPPEGRRGGGRGRN